MGDTVCGYCGRKLKIQWAASIPRCSVCSQVIRGPQDAIPDQVALETEQTGFAHEMSQLVAHSVRQLLLGAVFLTMALVWWLLFVLAFPLSVFLPWDWTS